MHVAATVARLPLGLLFVAAGAAGLLFAPPPQPSAAGESTAVVYATPS